MRCRLLFVLVLAGCSAPANPPPPPPVATPNPATSPLVPGQSAMLYDPKEQKIFMGECLWGVPVGTIVRVVEVKAGGRVTINAPSKGVDFALCDPPEGNIVADVPRANLRPVPQTLPDAAP
jgi:putative hemolysin